MPPTEDRPRRRRDLHVLRRQIEDEVFYVVGDPVSNDYLRLGESEHTILDLLDGRRDLRAVATAFELRTGLSIDPVDLAEFVDSLRQQGIVESSGFDPAVLLEEFRRRERAAAASRRMISGSLALLKFMPFDPDRLLGRLARRLSWCWSRGFFVVTAALVLAASVLAAMSWHRLVPAYSDLLERTFGGGKTEFLGRMIAFYAVGGVILIVHEAAHGLTLKHYGGTVPEMGLALAYFQFPGAYTDTTASYLLPSRFQRVMVSLSGGYTGLILSAAALFAWWATLPGEIINEVALIVMVLGGPLTLLFNWNPLVPFDGYYMAVDMLEAPNLLPSSLAHLGDLIRTRVFGVPALHPRPPVRLRRIFAVFGGLAWSYQALWTVAVPFVVYYMVSRVAGTLVGGLVAGILTLRLAGSLTGRVRRFFQVLGQEDPRAVRWRWTSRVPAVALAVVVSAVLFLPVIPVHVHGAGRLAPQSRREVRAATPGFVAEILVPEGRLVEAGQPLVRLVNPDLVARLDELRIDRDMSRVRWTMSDSAGDASAVSARRDECERLAAQIEILGGRERDLILDAPAAGTLLADRLADRRWTYLPEGALWGEIVGGDHLRVVVEIEEQRLADVRRGARVVAIVGGYPGERFEGSVVRLPQQRSAALGTASASMADEVPEEGRPTYGVEVEIANRDGRLRPGMFANVRIDGPRMSVAARILRETNKLLKGRVWW